MKGAVTVERERPLDPQRSRDFGKPSGGDARSDDAFPCTSKSGRVRGLAECPITGSG